MKGLYFVKFYRILLAIPYVPAFGVIPLFFQAGLEFWRVLLPYLVNPGPLLGP